MIITCPNCCHELEAPDTAVGKRLRCPVCQGVFQAQLPRAQVLDDEPQTADVTILDELPAADYEPVAPAEADPLDDLARTLEAGGERDVLGDADILFEEPVASAPPRPTPSPEGKGWYILTDTGWEEMPLTTEEVYRRCQSGNLEGQTRLFHARRGVVVRVEKLVALVAAHLRRIAEQQAAQHSLVQADEAETQTDAIDEDSSALEALQAVLQSQPDRNAGPSADCQTN